MSHEWLDTSYPQSLETSEIELPRTKEIIALLSAENYGGAKVFETRKGPNGFELLIIEIETPLGQAEITNDIRTYEPLAIFISPEDILPSVAPLRLDFPDVPHLNSVPKGYPRTFCLYETGWDDIRSSWSALRFLNRIREWLQQTAYGKLHREDQPLDSILVGGSEFILIVPDIALEEGFENEVIVNRLSDDKNDLILYLETGDFENLKGNATLSGAIVLRSPPKQDGRLRFAPSNLSELLELDEELGFGIRQNISSYIAQWCSGGSPKLDRPFLILLLIPLEREHGSGIEVLAKHAIWTTSTAGLIGEAMGLLIRSPESGNKWGQCLFDSQEPNGLGEIPVFIGDIRQDFSQSLAMLSSNKKNNVKKIFLVGAGAIGSHIAMNLAREGYGQWVVVDCDQLLPHNLARHALTSKFVGMNKAYALAYALNELYRDEKFCKSLSCNLLHPSDLEEALIREISSSDLIIDCSASISVSRSLAQMAAKSAQVISAFFSPSGKDLVLLSEGAEQQQSLFEVESSYYEHLVNTDQFHGHLDQPEGAIYHGTNCREPSVQMDESSVSLLAGLASREIHQLRNVKSSEISIWRANNTALSLELRESVLSYIQIDNFAGWEIRVSSIVQNHLVEERSYANELETGGILLGIVDRHHKIILISSSLGPTMDSTHQTTGFVRGSRGLNEKLNSVAKITAGNIQYVGEWHSHPPGAPSQMSKDDEDFIATLAETTALEELPSIMMIVADNEMRISARDNRSDSTSEALLPLPN